MNEEYPGRCIHGWVGIGCADCKAATVSKRWAVKCGAPWVVAHAWIDQWDDARPALSCLMPSTKEHRTVFTSLRLARAVALVTGGKVWRVKS